MEHLRGLTVIKANDSKYRHGIQNDMGDIVADVTGFTNGREIATLFSVAHELLAACELAKQLLDALRRETPIADYLLEPQKAAFEHVDQVLIDEIAKARRE